ncbi:unnamed protein product [Pseudo-nitzschia multistriata]|uniref:Uncharacterized protein n=1 Tax=Pseudo-nitzschia multistriata TaxID=183589 RepID=A0A448YW29_9STRA|nr:unnamed protein product [Pseudo-nitzschia multistriata]
MSAKRYPRSVVPLALLLALFSMAVSVLASTEGSQRIAAGRSRAEERGGIRGLAGAGQAAGSSSDDDDDDNANEDTTAAPKKDDRSSPAVSPKTSGQKATAPTEPKTSSPSKATTVSIASRTSSVASATKEPLSASMQFETPQTASPQTSPGVSKSSPSSGGSKPEKDAAASSKPSSASSSDTTESPVASGSTTTTTSSSVGVGVGTEGNQTATGDDDLYALASPTADNGDDNFASVIFSTSNNSTKPLVLPKEKEQPKQWPEIVGGIFVAGGISFFLATYCKNYQKRRQYDQVPASLTV